MWSLRSAVAVISKGSHRINLLLPLSAYPDQGLPQKTTCFAGSAFCFGHGFMPHSVHDGNELDSENVKEEGIQEAMVEINFAWTAAFPPTLL